MKFRDFFEDGLYSLRKEHVETIACFRIHDKKGGEDEARRARRRTQAG